MFHFAAHFQVLYMFIPTCLIAENMFEFHIDHAVTHDSHEMCMKDIEN